ncbi:MAG: DUF2892 domain-containing protein [Gemmatimonadetes bacterium]|nr:DUF2892 domain-containing protein [Gemmatimonadota bacterium]
MFAKILPHNEHTLDRVLRVLLGVVLLSVVFIGPKTPWGWVGAVLLFTAFVGSCPFYTVMGWRTCAANDRS